MGGENSPMVYSWGGVGRREGGREGRREEEKKGSLSHLMLLFHEQL